MNKSNTYQTLTPCLILKAPKPRKPQTKEEFGYFLAGLIDADGHINKRGHIDIAFHTNEVSVAYYIKAILGLGSVTRVKNEFTALYRCYAKKDLTIIANLIRHKLRHLDKINQFNERLVPKLKCEPTVYTDTDLSQNHWLAGFIQGDASFIIRIPRGGASLIKKPGFEVRLHLKQKAETLLCLTKSAFGGSICYGRSDDTFKYAGSSKITTAKWINYLDQYQLIGNRLTQYFIWREACLIIHSKQHLTESGKYLMSEKKEMLN